MSLNKNDLKQIKGIVKEVAIGTIKPMMKEVVLEVMEPMMIATQKEFDGINDKFDKVDERFDKVDEKLAEHDSRFTALEIAMKFGFNESKKRDEKLEAKIDKSITLLDGYVNKQESFKREFTVVKEEMRQVKGVMKNKLGVEIKAV